MEDKVYSEYSDGSYVSATIIDGELVRCPDIKISPPNPWGGAMTLQQALDFLSRIKEKLDGMSI